MMARPTVVASEVKPSPSAPSYDVVIAGASFAGLAAAQRLRGRILLLDREPLGDGVTSACAAPVSVVEAMGASAAVQQVHDRLIMHTPHRESDWLLPEPFCTFDYRRFCELAFEQTTAEFRKTTAVRRNDTSVLTGEGEIPARFAIDATGWRAVLANGSPRIPRLLKAFGIESEVPADVGPGLHFYFLPEVRDGYAWAFPCGGAVRFGVLSYLGRTKLWDGLVRFMARFSLRPGPMHGGYLATGFRDPVYENVFVAGDASGQCLPLTGEGIRTAILAGYRAGDLLQGVLDGRRSFADAAADYRGFVAGERRRYRALLWGNLALLAMPLRLTGAAAAYVARPGPLSVFMRHYLGIFAGSPQPAAVPR